MMIRSMTATFGKLEHETLTLQPGLNVVDAPNEWGKSTWCAFVLAMLYGLDTRPKSSRNPLPEKERFTPWSGSPMSGRMELEWNGREITIERTTRGRIPMGMFQAYETRSGLPVPELNAANCGAQLLGVERSVFQRAGFIRLTDMAVTQDDALRRRLNALVTTGDESGDGARLEKGLKDLKNRCRGRSGLIPQAQQEEKRLRSALEELAQLQQRRSQLSGRLEENAALQRQLMNHEAAMAYSGALEDQRRVEQAEQARDRAEERLEELKQACAKLPSRETAKRAAGRLSAHRDRLLELTDLQQSPPPKQPRPPRPFAGMDPAEAFDRTRRDIQRLSALRAPVYWLLPALALALFAGALVLLWQRYPIPGVALAAASMGVMGLAIWKKLQRDREKEALYRQYGSDNPEKWLMLANQYEAVMDEYHRAEQRYWDRQQEQEYRRQQLARQHADLCGDTDVNEALAYWTDILKAWEELDAAQAQARQLAEQCENLRAVAPALPEAPEEDRLTYGREQTRQMLRDAQQEQRTLQSRLGECRGRMEALGDPAVLEDRLAQVQEWIRALEKTDAALELAQRTLVQAAEELQRRFAPRIAQRAQTLLEQMTFGRYDRVRLGSDLSVQSGTRQEDVLRQAPWRSDGTADQLYLALRLAVAEALTPQAPLILDDALVRFDDDRLTAALEILREQSRQRQVILFTCQERERKLLWEDKPPIELQG